MLKKLTALFTAIVISISLFAVPTYAVGSVKAPTASKASGTYYTNKSGFSVKLSAASGAAIYYTQKNGSKVVADNKKYTSAIKVTENCTISAYAKVGKTKSKSVTWTYKLAAKPVFKTKTNKNGSVTITIEDANGVEASNSKCLFKCYFTTNGSTPTTKSDVYYYPVTVSETTKISVLAVPNIKNWAQSKTSKTIKFKESTNNSTSTSENISDNTNEIPKTGKVNGVKVSEIKKIITDTYYDGTKATVVFTKSGKPVTGIKGADKVLNDLYEITNGKFFEYEHKWFYNLASKEDKKQYELSMLGNFISYYLSRNRAAIDGQVQESSFGTVRALIETYETNPKRYNELIAIIKNVVSNASKYKTTYEQLASIRDDENKLMKYDDWHCNPFVEERFFDAGCNGYTRMFLFFCNCMGIECLDYSGLGFNGYEWGGHGWNIVNIDGKWYWVDPTFEDVQLGKHFCQGTTNFSKNHKFEGYDKCNLPYPTASKTDYVPSKSESETLKEQDINRILNGETKDINVLLKMAKFLSDANLVECFNELEISYSDPGVCNIECGSDAIIFRGKKLGKTTATIKRNGKVVKIYNITVK